MQEPIARAVELIQTGGWVMVPLVALSLLSLTLLFERAWYWIRVHGPGSGRAFESARAAISSRDANVKPRSLYESFASSLLNSQSPGRAEIAADEVRPSIERFGSTLTTIITAAPLLGILGTVTGIIESFGLLGSSSVVTDPDQLAKGISEALYTTAFGLIIALFTVFPYAIFRSNAERALNRLEILAACDVEKPDAPETSGPEKSGNAKN